MFLIQLLFTFLDENTALFLAYEKGYTEITQLLLNFHGIEFCDDVLSYCFNLKQITIPSTIKYIGKNAFLNCKSLEEIEIPSSVTRIESNAFESCISLCKIEIPPSVNFCY